MLIMCNNITWDAKGVWCTSPLSTSTSIQFDQKI